jgi:hypothetical protein
MLARPEGSASADPPPAAESADLEFADLEFADLESAGLESVDAPPDPSPKKATKSGRVETPASSIGSLSGDGFS